MTVYAAEFYENVSTKGSPMPDGGLEVMIYGDETVHPGSINGVILFLALSRDYVCRATVWDL
jgi:hypothetical protein